MKTYTLIFLMLCLAFRVQSQTALGSAESDESDESALVGEDLHEELDDDVIESYFRQLRVGAIVHQLDSIAKLIGLKPATFVLECATENHDRTVLFFVNTSAPRSVARWFKRKHKKDRDLECLVRQPFHVMITFPYKGRHAPVAEVIIPAKKRIRT